MAVAEPDARERRTLRLLGRWILWVVLPLILLAMGLWDISHRVSWMGFGPDTVRGSFRGDMDYTLEGMPAVVNGIALILVALALHAGLWVHLKGKKLRWLPTARGALWIVAVVTFLTVHWVLSPLSQR